MFTEHWTKLSSFVRSRSLTGQYVKVLSSRDESLDKYERFCPEFPLWHNPILSISLSRNAPL